MLLCIGFVYFILSEQIYGSILLLVDIFQPETHKLIYVMLLTNEILNMGDILVQKMLFYSKIRFGLFSRVLLWIIACHLRWIFLLHVAVFVCQVSQEQETENNPRKLTHDAVNQILSRIWHHAKYYKNRFSFCACLFDVRHISNIGQILRFDIFIFI